MSRYGEADLARLKTVKLEARASLVHVENFARPLPRGAASAFLDSLPRILAGTSLREIVEAVAAARRGGRAVVAMVGGHVVKTGVSPCLVEWLDAGVLTAVAMNGAAAIHDVEVALCGRTSEDVEAGLRLGTFGMAEETAAFVNGAAIEAARRSEGLGEALGRLLIERAAPYRGVSLLASAHRAGVPATVHVAIGADVVHAHAACDGASVGDSSHRDFRILAAALAQVGSGVVMNIGSAVILPEVFLKALTVARNLGADPSGLVTVNLDFLQHYRPTQNVVVRPVRGVGRGYGVTGHHEFLVPLLTGAVLDALGTDALEPRNPL
jgi:hypothetical protein